MKTKRKVQKTNFVFFKDNRMDGKFSLSEQQIKEKYIDWLKAKEISWIEYYGHKTVWSFISEKEGLSSVVDDPADYVDLEDLLMDVRHGYLKSLAKLTAAAPELLIACRNLLQCRIDQIEADGDKPENWQEIIQAQEAIKKATV